MADTRYPTNELPFQTMTDMDINQCYTRLDGSFGGCRPRHSHTLTYEDIHPDSDEQEWLRIQYDDIRRMLETLCDPEMVHFVLAVFPASHGSKTKLASTKVISRAKIRLDERELAEWLLVYWCVLEAMKKRHLR